ncbi:MAG: hypothetical protein ACFFDS_06550 [Candidatus Thorarchaeota archaeon]
MCIRKIFKKRYNQILRSFEESQISLKATNPNFYGQFSLGRGQVRGNGVLILTADNLFFEMYFPKKKFTFPLKNIRSVDTVKSFLGKTQFRQLLQISFINDDGEEDSAAWLVKDLDVWLSRIKQVIQMKK